MMGLVSKFGAQHNQPLESNCTVCVISKVDMSLVVTPVEHCLEGQGPLLVSCVLCKAVVTGDVSNFYHCFSRQVLIVNE